MLELDLRMPDQMLSITILVIPMLKNRVFILPEGRVFIIVLFLAFSAHRVCF